MNKEKTYCGARLKQLRDGMGLTLDMFVEDINTRYGTTFDKGRVSRWERDIADPDLISARYISEYYNVSLDYIIGLTDVKTPSRLLASASRKVPEDPVIKLNHYTPAPARQRRPRPKTSILTADDDFEFEFLNMDDEESKGKK